jgi:hypothetical protein
VLNLRPVELIQIVEVTQVVQARVGDGDGQHLVVAAGLIAHSEHRDGSTSHKTTREGRLLDQHEHVKRVAGLAQRILDEPVVGGILGGRKHRPVKLNTTRLVVEFVLVALTLRYFDGDVETAPCPRSTRGGFRAGLAQSGLLRS